MRTYTPVEAREVIVMADRYASQAIQLSGSRVIYAADEFYCLAGVTVPDTDYYESFPQLENGVGMIRQFEDELREAKRTMPDAGGQPAQVTIACGTSIYPYMKKWMQELVPQAVTVQNIPTPQ